MPKSIRQRRGEVIASLRGKNLISIADLENALAEAGIESAEWTKRYIEKMEKLGDLMRVSGGWKLSKESKKTGVITIKVTPAQNQGDVLRSLDSVLHQFGKLVTVEVEA